MEDVSGVLHGGWMNQWVRSTLVTGATDTFPFLTGIFHTVRLTSRPNYQIDFFWVCFSHHNMGLYRWSFILKV